MATLGNPGVVDEDVDASELRQRGGGHVVDRFGVCEVGHPGSTVGVVAAAPFQDGGEAVASTGADPDGGARRRERLGEAGADPRRRSGHEHTFGGQVVGHRSSLPRRCGRATRPGW